MAVFAADYREEPYWWMAAPPDPADGAGGPVDGAAADVAVVGGGITGLVAALTLARAGADVVVLDAGPIGGGAARMNAGFLGRTLKRSVGWLERRHGADHARRVYGELDDALKAVETLVADEGIDCHRRTCGRFIAANLQPHLKHLVADLEEMKQKLGFDYHVVGKAGQRDEVASDRFEGGAVVPALGSIHPGLYHAGLLARAKAAGVRLQSATTVLAVEADGGRKAVRTDRGTLSARDVVVATNGYTTRGLKWFARRLVPFRGYMLATEPLPPGLIDRVLPKRRTYLDTKMNIDFFRPAPDSERILFGGMTGRLTRSATAMVPALHRRMAEILPDLKDVAVSRAWTGFCAGTFDFMPHIGVRDGVHYALGYNFAGVPIGTAFGLKTAARILGRPGAASAFDTESFPTLPLFNGTGLVAPAAMRYFDWLDRRIARGK